MKPSLKGAGGGANGGTDFANMLKPYMGRGKLKVIASTTPEEYNASFEKDLALCAFFYLLQLTNPHTNLQKKYLQTVPLIMRSSSTVNLHMKHR